MWRWKVGDCRGDGQGGVGREGWAGGPEDLRAEKPLCVRLWGWIQVILHVSTPPPPTCTPQEGALV